jgi:CheY-like chemotaxis protein
MPIYRILQNVAFEPERIDSLVLAYERILRALRLGRSDPLTNDIARTLFAFAQQGERDVDRLLERTVFELGISMPERHEESGRKSSDHKTRTLLIVDDDEAFAYAAGRYFKGLGFETIVASGSISAFRELERRPVDAMIADVRLGTDEPHGISLGRMVRNVNREMPVLLVTAYPELLEREKPLPGPSFVKPVDLKLLASAVRASLT